MNVCKRVWKRTRRLIAGGRSSTRSIPPQGKINPSASRTRLKIVPPDPGKSPFGTEGIIEEVADEELKITLHTDDLSEARRQAITDSGAAIFTAYLQGDLEAAKIVDGWALKGRERAQEALRPLPGPPVPPKGWRRLRALLGLQDGATGRVT